METEKRPGSEPEPVVSERRPYEKPGVVWTHRTELIANVASACSRFGGGGGTCDSNPSS